MSIASDIQKLDPGSIIELFELDTTGIGGSGIDRFHSGVNGLSANVVWQGNTYTKYPISASGFEKTGSGPAPRPSLQVANLDGLIGAFAAEFDDLLNAKITRKRTFAKYLDAVNFASGVNPTADPNAGFDDEVYYVARKANENKIFVEFELAAANDLNGVYIPLRQVIANVCPWRYRSAECSYSGGAVADINDVPTTDSAQDQCGKRLTSCKLRFGEYNPLPYGGYPAAARI
ncbi:MAG TPA: phage minor tail protein L [Methylophilaceae bacterium]|nr:phage minor tail protein L [Methylophilaceae bacterium]